MRLDMISVHSAERAGAEAMVRDVYWREYGAEYPALPPMMVAALDVAGQPQCVAGVREPSDGFFSEQYLEEPAHVAISRGTGQHVARSEIVEIGPLASRRPGAVAYLLLALVRFGLASGYRWGLFTGTERLRQLAFRLRLPVVDLGPARASSLASPGNWGTYYDFDPRVCAIDGAAARGTLRIARVPALAQRHAPGAAA